MSLAATAHAEDAPQPGDRPPDSDVRTTPVIEPDVDRRNIKVPRIKSRDLEFGAYYGIYSAENFGSAPVAGLRLAYHVTEDIFFEGAYGSTTVSDSLFRGIYPGGIFANEEEKLTYYSVSLGYNFFPGEVFIGKGRAMTSAVYVIGGVGNTDFAQESHATINFGMGIRVLPTDWLGIHLDMRDNVFKSDILGTNKTTNNFELHASLTVYF
jgi:outer membrane beta-barrel protein